ncbi:MAG: FAD-binding protein [Dehalococcoidales bacterium]|nr:FAD-binding protein [Dehalococcoidales bacterium]
MTSRYNRLSDSLIASLIEIAGQKNVITGEGMENYSRDETPDINPALPEAVVTPENSASVSRVLRLACDNNIAVTPRGGGTGLSAGAVPLFGGIVLSLEKMDRIIEIDEANFTGTVEAGVTLEKFTQAVSEKGLYFPLYPGEQTATLGGNIATNAGGMRAVRYGVARNFVLGLEAVLPTGEIINTGGKFFKCSTGYDLTQLITGSEGTLAVITSVILKLTNPAGKSEILFVPFNSLGNAIETVPEILKKGILPVGIEFMQRSTIEIAEQFTGHEIPYHNHEAFLMIFVEDENEEGILNQVSRISEICLSGGAVDVFIPGSERAKRELLETREKVYPAVRRHGMLTMADVVVPRSMIAVFVEKAEIIVRGSGLGFVTVGHAGDGNVHIMLTGESSEANKSLAHDLLGHIFELGVSMGGMISGEHGIGSEKEVFLPLALSREKIELMRRIKQAFDPCNILNPGKVLFP